MSTVYSFYFNANVALLFIGYVFMLQVVYRSTGELQVQADTSTGIIICFGVINVAITENADPLKPPKKRVHLF